MSMVHVCALLLTLAFHDDPKPLPELKTFLAEFRKTLHSDNLLLSEYTYTEKRTSIQLDSEQNPKKTEVNVYEVFPGSPDRPRYRRHIVKNGVPVSAKDLEKQDEEHKRRIAKRKQADPQEREKKRAEARREDDKVMDDIFATYDIQIVGRENIGDEPAIVVVFKPRPNYKPKTGDGKIMQHIAGRAWISELDYELARLDAEAIDSISIGFGMLAKVHKGTHLFAERRKFNNEVWLPAKSEASVSGRFLMLKGIHMREIVEYSDHKKYSVETILKFPGTEKPPEP